ncbi:MAG TPA: MaoC/PaaZ C-terminal domain-containing protein [Vicinamibacterales bacterium]|nr:MaoC/PaaZ C-terminal domain-containing protein [Vicinamibacterales bacterium]
MFYEDIEVGHSVRVGSYRVDADDIVSYARRWDPLPVHVDEAAARRTMFGGLTASGSHTLAIRTLLLHRVPIQDGVIAAGGWDEVRFHAPVRPGDELSLEVTWLAKRRSASKPDRGIVTALMKLLNQESAVVLSHKDTIFMRLRNPEGV